MIDPKHVLEAVTSIKVAIDVFDKIGGQIKSLLSHRPNEKEGNEDRWHYKITGETDQIVVRRDKVTIQVLTGAQLAERLSADDLCLVRTYEQHMSRNYRLWQAVYKKKDASPDALVNAQTEEQLAEIVKGMKDDLTGIIDFLQRIGVHLDDHYMHIRYLIGEFANHA